MRYSLYRMTNKIVIYYCFYALANKTIIIYYKLLSKTIFLLNVDKINLAK